MFGPVEEEKVTGFGFTPEPVLISGGDGGESNSPASYKPDQTTPRVAGPVDVLGRDGKSNQQCPWWQRSSS